MHHKSIVHQLLVIGFPLLCNGEAYLSVMGSLSVMGVYTLCALEHSILTLSSSKSKTTSFLPKHRCSYRKLFFFFFCKWTNFIVFSFFFLCLFEVIKWLSERVRQVEHLHLLTSIAHVCTPMILNMVKIYLMCRYVIMLNVWYGRYIIINLHSCLVLGKKCEENLWRNSFCGRCT